MSSIPAFYFAKEDLDRVAAEREVEFKSGQPFPHLVMDGFFPRSIADALVAEFPGVDDIEWQEWGPGRTRRIGRQPSLDKLGQSDEEHFGDLTRHVMGQLYSATFLSFLEKLTGFGRLITDPTYNGCGLHSTGRGGRLMIHADANRHPHSGKILHQILNLVVYLNPDWKEEYGGHLELWTKDRKPFARILPVLNRAVLFFTGTRAFHGHPTPLTCPAGRRRQSLALYYYTTHRPEDDGYQGMQRDVRWISTTPEDVEVEEGLFEVGVQALRSFFGLSLPAVQETLTAALPPGFDPVDELAVRFFDWNEMDAGARARVRESHLNSIAPKESPPLEEFTPFGSICARGDFDPMSPRAVLLLYHRDGSVHAVQPGRSNLQFLEAGLAQFLSHWATL